MSVLAARSDVCRRIAVQVQPGGKAGAHVERKPTVVSRKRRAADLVPMMGWLRSYDRRWLRGDLIAG